MYFQRTPSGDVWDGVNGGPGGNLLNPLAGGNRPRYASESNLLRAPLKPMAPYASVREFFYVIYCNFW